MSLGYVCGALVSALNNKVSLHYIPELSDISLIGMSLNNGGRPRKGATSNDLNL